MKTYTIEDCCDILDSQRIPLNKQQRQKIQGKTPYYGANGVQGYINDFIFDEDLILIAEDGGNFEQFATRPIAYKISGKSWVNNHAHILRAKEGFDQDFIFYSLVNKNILNFISGGTRSKLNQSELRAITLLLPEYDEQAKISEVVSTIDRAIAQTEALIAKHHRIKTGLMQDLLTRGIDENGQLRDPSTPRFRSTLLGMIPEEWEVVPLKSKITIKHGYSFLGEFFSDADNGNLLLTPGNFHVEGGLYFDSEKTKYYTGKIPKEFILKNGDVLVVMTDLTKEMAILGNTAILDYPQNVLHNQRIGLVQQISKDKMNSKYLTLLMNSDFCKSVVKMTATGTTVRHTSPTKILSAVLPFAKPDEQERIVKVIDNSENQIANLKKSIVKLCSLKTGLMQDLLSGKVSVKPLMEGQNPVNTDNQKQTKEEIDNLLSETQKEHLLTIQGTEQDIVIGVPHHAPLGVSNLPNHEHPASDENAGFVGAEVARLLNCNCVIACNARNDPNKNKETDYSQQILSWKPRLLIEIHVHGGKRARFDIEISGGALDRNKWSQGLEERLKKKMSTEPLLKDFTVSGDFSKIYFTAANSYTITAKEWAALHIELPKKIRESPEIYMPFCKILAESVSELMANFDNIAKS